MDKRSILFLVVLSAGFLFVSNYLFPPVEAPPVQSAPPSAVSDAAKRLSSKPGEQFYVLENKYQQLVFSSIGGGLAEINLPLQGPNNSASGVRPIEFDRVMEEKLPQLDQFPAQPAQGSSGTSVAPQLGGYYPLTRRGVDARYYSLAVLSESGELPPSSFSLKALEKNKIVLESKFDQGRITKTITLPENPDDTPYCFTLSITTEGLARNYHLSTGIPEVELISGSAAPTLKYRVNHTKKAVVEQLDLPKTSSTITSVLPDWICNSNGFLGVVLDPLSTESSGFSSHFVPGEVAPTRIALIDAEYDLYPASKYPGYLMTLPIPKNGNEVSFRVYAGPFAKDLLAQVDHYYQDPKTGTNPEFVSCISFHGWFSFISEPFAKFLFFLMKIFHFISRSWGVSIILLTIALRIMLYPLNAWTIKSTIKMQEVAPKVASIQERYKKEPKKAQMEIMNLYRQNGVNPLGGCLPLLIQMPFLIGMFDLLKSSFELRGVSFIPGWINNLTAPDVVFSWSYPIWFFGTSFHLLPILLGIVMFVQQQLSANIPKDKSLWTDQQRQQKFMGNLMVIVFSVLFYHFPSGLNIYWLSSMLLGILQQWWTTKNKLKVA